VSGFDSAAIQLHLDRAKPGDTIELAAGTYTITEAIRPKSRTRLIGAGQEKTIIRFGGEKPDVMIHVPGCEDVEIAHITLDAEDSPLVRGGHSDRAVIEDNRIDHWLTAMIASLFWPNTPFAIL
jgi:hypothetical protein